MHRGTRHKGTSYGYSALRWTKVYCMYMRACTYLPLLSLGLVLLLVRLENLKNEGKCKNEIALINKSVISTDESSQENMLKCYSQILCEGCVENFRFWLLNPRPTKVFLVTRTTRGGGCHPLIISK